VPITNRPKPRLRPLREPNQLRSRSARATGWALQASAMTFMAWSRSPGFGVNDLVQGWD